MSDSEGESYEKQVKVVLVGDGSAGKVDRIHEKKKKKTSVGFFPRLLFRKDFPKMHSIEIIIKH